MKAKHWLLKAFLLLLAAAPLAQAIDPLSISAYPGASLPISGDGGYFTAGGGIALAGVYRMPFLPLLALRGELGYDYLPVWTSGGLNLLTSGAGLQLFLALTPKLNGWLHGSAGYYYGFVSGSNDSAGGNLYFSSGLGLDFALQPSLSLGTEARYRWLLDGEGGMLFTGLSAGLGVRFTLLSRKPIRIENLRLSPVFPVLYKYYSSHPIGTLTLRNEGSIALEDVTVTVTVERFMDNPTECAAFKQLPAGGSREVEVFALFNEKALEITEGEVVSARVAVQYAIRGKPLRAEAAQPLRLYDRHAISWDDDRKAAAYVTAKDPVVLELAKPIARLSREQAAGGFDDNFRIAVAVHEALRLYGVNYVVDPSTPYAQFSREALAVDYLQFPANTLKYRAGDCDDLSILYSAMLESVGVPTAFITVPGHIYLAFQLSMPLEEARRSFLQPGDLIEQGGKAWVPLEITLVQSSFLEAWSAGARQWRENKQRDAARMYPLSECWQDFEPVASVGERLRIEAPEERLLLAAYLKEMDRFVARETQGRIAELERQIVQSKESWKQRNSLGVLYARYGQLDKAFAQFSEAVRKKDYLPALFNLGNLYYKQNRLDKALEFFQRASTSSPNNPAVLLQLSRCYYELGRLEDSALLFERVRRADPRLAGQFPYLDAQRGQAARAGAYEVGKGVVLWQEE